MTCVKVVEGRTEVLIKNSKGHIHVAQLLLTSTTLGVALFSIHVWQGTFALAFLSRVAGPASLPHRLFVDVDRSDRVYVIGYDCNFITRALTNPTPNLIFTSVTDQDSLSELSTNHHHIFPNVH